MIDINRNPARRDLVGFGALLPVCVALVGAMAQCPRCAFVPQKTEDKAKSILLSDRCAKMAVLEKVAQKIARGETA